MKKLPWFERFWNRRLTAILFTLAVMSLLLLRFDLPAQIESIFERIVSELAQQTKA